MSLPLIKHARRYGALATLLLAGCLETYNPPAETQVFDNLVVDAMVNATDHTATVKLSRPQPLDQFEGTTWVRNATISITGPSGEIFLNETEPGKYVNTNIPITIGGDYTLQITTPDGREFYSDPVEALATPPIDSLTLGITNDNKGAEIRLNTRDESGNAQYFSWEYIETYEYTAAYNSGFLWNKGNPVIRRPDQSIWRCWRSIPSSSIGIVTTEDLSASVVSQHPIVTIPAGSLKLSILYSVLVMQRVIGANEYNYLRQLKNTTENLGGLFDPQPGVVLGNIHEKDKPGTQVLGYFTVTEVEQKRFFVSWEELPEIIKIPQSYGNCWLEETCDTRPGSLKIGCIAIEDIGERSNVIYAVYDARGVPIGFKFTNERCSDCRFQGGVVKRPDFWPPPN